MSGAEQRKAAILAMKPGREYTAGDIKNLAKIGIIQAGRALSDLHDMGLIERDKGPYGFLLYRLPLTGEGKRGKVGESEGRKL